MDERHASHAREQRAVRDRRNERGVYAALALLVVGVVVAILLEPVDTSDKSLWVNRDNHGRIVLGVVFGLVAGAMIEHVREARTRSVDAYSWWAYLALPLAWASLVTVLVGLLLLYAIAGVESALR